MYLVAVHGWQKDDAEVAGIIAGILGLIVFEARLKIAGGGPAVVGSFADPQQAEILVSRLVAAEIPALLIDSVTLRQRIPPFTVRRFVLAASGILLQSLDGEERTIDYGAIEKLIVATGTTQAKTTAKVTERKFSLGKTLLAGGIPMSKHVTREEIVANEERDEILRLYTAEAEVIFNRGALNYDGLGAAMQLSRDLNFVHLRKELQRSAPQAIYDERLLKRANLIRLLGPTLSPEADLDLACEILARALCR